ncbi:MAG: spore germination protein, partial [Alicyclobacillus sp.]|nr:spore germination protein [Alicyclobacillus sp.]
MPRVQENAKVGAKEMTAMMTVLVASHVFLYYPRYVSQYGMEAAWMIPLFSGLLTLVLFLAVEGLLRRHFTGMSMIEVARAAFGHTGAGVFAVLVALYFLLVTASIMRQFVENVITTVLPATPILVVSGLFVLTVCYLVRSGLEGIARVSYMALPVLLLGTTALVLLTYNWWRPAYLMPLWGNGPVGVLRVVFHSSSVFHNVM